MDAKIWTLNIYTNITHDIFFCSYRAQWTSWSRRPTWHWWWGLTPGETSSWKPLQSAQVLYCEKPTVFPAQTLGGCTQRFMQPTEHFLIQLVIILWFKVCYSNAAGSFCFFLFGSCKSATENITVLLNMHERQKFRVLRWTLWPCFLKTFYLCYCIYVNISLVIFI